MQPLSTGRTFSKFFYLNTFHSFCAAAAVPCDVTLPLWPAPLTSSLLHAHGCSPTCSGVTCGQEKSQPAWASMGGTPCCWPSWKQLCLIQETFILESNPTDPGQHHRHPAEGGKRGSASQARAHPPGQADFSLR